MTTTFICCFTSGVDEMKRKDQADPLKVLKALDHFKRFSVFEATANQTIAKTMTRFFHGDLKHLIVKTGGAYPWTNVRLTPEGRKFIEDQKE